MASGGMIIHLRDPESYPDALKVILNMCTFNEVPKIVGSYSRTEHRYPSDIDVFEENYVSLGFQDAANYYAGRFKNIIEQLIIANPKYIITEFKAGRDDRLINIYQTPGNIMSNPTVKSKLEGILGPSDYKYLYNLTTDRDFRSEIRRLSLVKWTPEEVLLGVKELRGGKFITFNEAVAQHSILKLDVITWITGKYWSVEIFYSLGYTDPATQDKKKFFELGDYVISLMRDINYFGSREGYSPLKLAKRLWTLSQLIDCTDMLETINPLLISNAAALGQIEHDIELIYRLLRTNPLRFNNFISLNRNSPIRERDIQLHINKLFERIFLESLGFSKGLSNHLPIVLYTQLSVAFDSIFVLWTEFKSTGKFNAPKLISYLGEISKVIAPEIEKESSTFLTHIENLNMVCKEQLSKRQ